MLIKFTRPCTVACELLCDVKLYILLIHVKNYMILSVGFLYFDLGASCYVWSNGPRPEIIWLKTSMLMQTICKWLH